MRERLQKYLARVGVASRRGAETMIAAGRVQVNNQKATLGSTIQPDVDEIRVDGRVVKSPEQLVYLLLNKPTGYVTTARDELGRRTVLDLVKDVSERVYPVGRLDLNTEGLLLLTNDGFLAYRLTHPRYEIRKTYHAFIHGIPNKGTLSQLKSGIILDGRKTAPAKVRVLRSLGKESLVEISIHEGRNHQVRRMFAQVGHPVKRLTRVGLASLDLKDLALGHYRHLKQNEVDKLYQLISSY